MTSQAVTHGTVSGYKYLGCRCRDCRAATVRYEKRRRWLVHQGLMPTVPAHGFNRRVRALMALGWTQKEIAGELGIAQGNLALKLRSNLTVRRGTHEAMAEVYERLCMTRRADSPGARRTATIAANRGWPPPLAWDDIDDEHEQPSKWQYSEPRGRELVAQWHSLQRQGYTRAAAAHRMGIPKKRLEKAIERHQRRRDAS